MGILFALLFAYKSKMIKPTENFKLGLFAATGGIALVYIISFFMSMFGGSGLPVMDPSNSSMMSIGFSLIVVAVASLNLVMDFDFIEEGAFPISFFCIFCKFTSIYKGTLQTLFRKSAKKCI